VRTQLPYALTTGAFAIFLGILPASYGVSVWLLIPIGIFGMFLLLHFLGKKSDNYKVVE